MTRPEQDVELTHRVLLVEDQATLAEWVRATLEQHADIVVTTCSQAALAVERARAVRPSLIIQDLLMPHADGFTLLARYRNVPELEGVPVIVLSAISDVQEKGRAFALGAADYLVKVPHPIELVARVRAHSRAYLLRKERDVLAGELAATMRQLAESNVELARAARQDGITGLANRRALDEALEAEWRRGLRDGKPLSFVLIDLDYFRLYNERYGRARGDECLRAVGGVLRATARRAADLAARYGGEQLALLLPSTPAEGARAVAERARAGIAQLELPHEGRPDGCGQLSVSVGVASLVPSAEEQQRVLVEAADAALHQAKRRGRDRVLHAGLDR